MDKKPPLNLEHHYSDVTKAREPSKMKEYYKYFQIPGIGQLAGGEFLSLHAFTFFHCKAHVGS